MWHVLKDGSIEGVVVGVYERAYNLVVANGRFSAPVLFSFVQPPLGQGPFSIRLPDFVWPQLNPGQVVKLSQQKVMTDDWELPLADAAVWDPTLACLSSAFFSNAWLALLRPYIPWPQLEAPGGRFSTQLADYAAIYQKTISHSGDVVSAARSLIGCGGGLTPAGDDYLVGSMAALWLNKRPLPNLPPDLERRTTAVSRAYLQAACQGHFAEPWHQLGDAMEQGDVGACAQAIKWIAQTGATSGLDALAGFAQTVQTLNEPNKERGNF